MVGMETVVDEPTWVRRGSWVVCPVAGALLGWLVQALSGWVASLAWFPVQGPFRLLAGAEQPWKLLGALAVGLLLGAAFAVVWARDRLVVTVSPTRVTLERAGHRRRIDAELTAVFLDGKKLVLLGTGEREIARENTDLGHGELAAAFTGHGHPWLDEPPPER
jgi:hypothetical protein